MKKIMVLVLAALLTMLTAGITMAFDEKPEVYLDYGFSGDIEQKVGSGEANAFYKADSIHPIQIGFEYPVNNWLFGFEYNNIPNSDLSFIFGGQTQPLEAGEEYKINGSTQILKAGYRVINQDQCNLYIVGEYLWNTAKIKHTNADDGLSNTKFKTSALLVGPQVACQFDRFTLDGFVGYGLSVSQKEDTDYSYAEPDNTTFKDKKLLVYNFKFGYMFTDQFGLNLGYQYNRITSKLNAIDVEFSDKYDFWTLGAVYKF